MEKFKVKVQLLTELEKEIPLHKGVEMVVEEFSFYDALQNSLYERAHDLLSIKNKPERVVFEASGKHGDFDIMYLEGHVRYKPFKWKKVYEGSSFFNESGENPFSIDTKWVKPTLFERDIIQYLNDAFPAYEFKYVNESMCINLNDTWIDLIAFIKNLPDDKKSDFYFEVSENITPRYAEAFGKHRSALAFIYCVKNQFFPSHNLNVDIVKLITFDEIFNTTIIDK